MRIAFGIPRLAPPGGLEQNCIAIAERLARRGHAVTIHTAIGGDLSPAGVAVAALPVRALTSHGFTAGFARRFAAATAGGGFDLVVGFKRMPGLDVLYCADPSYIDGHGRAAVALSPRGRAFAALERACFGPGSRTRTICLSRPQLDAYRRQHGTPPERLALLPPTIERRKYRPDLRLPRHRQAAREALRLPATAVAWLWAGLQPKVKGLDRAVAALAARPEAVLLACGPAADDPALRPILAAAQRAGTAGRLRLLGFADEARMAELIAAADLLMHPARADVTGTVILEALVNGLPVVTTAVCGYSPFVTASGGGAVLPEPFEPDALATLAAAADAARSAAWAERLAGFGDDPALYSGLDRAADLIEAAGAGDRAAERWAALSGLGTNDER